MRDMVAHEIRRLHRKHARSERRTSLVDITGKVKAGSQDMDKRTVRLVLGKGADGEEILSAKVRWDQGGAGAYKTHATPKDGEQMALHSPSGSIGPTSLARWGTYDKDTEPPSKSKDEVVQEFGKAKVTHGKENTTYQFDDAKIILSKGKITLGVDGEAFEISKDKMEMKVKWVGKGGSRPAHYKGGKDSGGDTATDGNEDVLI